MSMNPITTKDTIKNDYMAYLSSLLTVRDEEITSKAYEEVKKTNFVKGPFLEATLPFHSGKSLHELHEQGIVSGEFSKISDDIHYDRKLYNHQEIAINKITAQRKNVIVATGTGSGKTECYLLPIINELMRQKENGKLNSGVRALLLFPMNALANDQLKKIRALMANYPSITFGRYTGETSFGTEEDAAKEYEEKYNKKSLPNEMFSRKRMQDTPPHILLTNYAMLEYLLLRPEESVFFEGQNARSWRFLVLDEAHTYKGSNGTEIALLFRRLKEKISKSNRDSLQCIATSATLGSEDAKEALAEFAQNIFGEEFHVEDIVTADRIKRKETEEMHPFTPEEYKSIFIEINGMKEEEKCSYVYNRLILDSRIIKVQNVLDKKPQVAEEVADIVFDDLYTKTDKMNAFINLVELAVMAKKDLDSSSLLPARYHMFVKSLEGMFVSFYPNKEIYLNRKSTVLKGANPISVFELSNCQKCGQEYIVGKIEDGYLKHVNDIDKPNYFLISKASEHEAIDVDVDDDDTIFEATDVSNLDKYILCTVCGKIEPVNENQDNKVNRCCNVNDKRKYIEVYGLSYSGKAKDINTCAMCGSVSPSVIKRFFTANHAATFVVANSLYSMIPPIIAEKDYYDEPEVNDDFFDAPTNKISNEIKSEMGRKLLIFSDNRQEAAFFAGYMSNKHNQISWRRIILNELKKQTNGIRMDDLMDLLLIQGEKLGLFTESEISKMSENQKKTLASSIVLKEFMGVERETGLEGRAYVEIYPEPIVGGQKWDLNKEEVWNVLRYFMDTVRFAGATKYPDSINPKDEIFIPRNREVYFRKEKRGSSGGKEIISFIPAKHRKNKRFNFVKKLIKIQGVSEEALDEGALRILDEAYDLFVNLEKRGYFTREPLGKEGYALRIDYRKWYFRFIENNETIYRCSKCGKIATYSVKGICHNLKCDGTLDTIKASEVRNDPYYSIIYNNEKIIPMIAKEHTAQLSKEAAGDYQKYFEDGKVNVLSCSTTFEMGVDVGELEATFLRNVPPETANYIQRAGRAGRRTSSTAFSVTFARRNSHDINFFNNPSEIISGKIKAPYIEIMNEKIASRHLNSVILSWFFKKKPIYFEENTKALIGYNGGIDIIQALGEELENKPLDLYESIKKVFPVELFKRLDIENWLFVDRLIGNEGVLTKAINKRKEDVDHFKNIKSKLYESGKNSDKINAMINTFLQEKTINFLASNGVLPKYGFPVDVVNLQILNNSVEAKTVELTRDLKLAISEFAPPGSVIANSKVWRSYAINVVPDKGWPTYKYYECQKCRSLSSPEINATIMEYDDNAEKPKMCRCGTQMKSKWFIKPIFGFSTSFDEEPKIVGDNRPKHFYSTRTQFWGIGELDSYQKEQRKEKEIIIGGKAVKIAYSPNGKLVVLNRGNKNSGLWVCKTCGYVKENPNDPKHKNKFGHDCPNTYLSNVSLGHDFSTDILRIELPIQYGKYDLLGKNKWKSLLYAILEGASDALGIARSDINGCLDEDSGQNVLILFDESAGGAGHVKQIYNKIDEVFLAALKRVNGNCGCSDETSCYGCLRNYSNQFEHDELVRGAAKEYLKWLIYGAKAEVKIDDESVKVDIVKYHKIINDENNNIYKYSDEWAEILSQVTETSEVIEFVEALAKADIDIPTEVGIDVLSKNHEGVICEAELLWDINDNEILVLKGENEAFIDVCKNQGYTTFVIGVNAPDEVVQEIKNRIGGSNGRECSKNHTIYRLRKSAVESS